MASSQNTSNLSGSPLKFPVSSTHNSGTERVLADVRVKMNDAMSGLFVGPMPVDQFLDEFLPQPVAVPLPGGISTTLFDRMPRTKLERQMYKPFIDLIQNNGLIPGYQIVNTSDYPDHDSDDKIRPDPTMYKSTVDVSKKVMQFGEIELHFELKVDKSHDPFDEPSPTDDRLNHRFEASGIGRSKDRSQLIHYATEWFSRQHRRFAFTVFICDPYVRFIRWDRAGAVVSEKFDYRKNSQPLIDFLWRFTHHDDAGRGLDPTVVPATTHQAELARLHLSEWKPEQERPFVVFKVRGVDGTPREFIAWNCMSHSGSLTGRCTRAYPVYEEATGKRYFLKDTWRAHDLAKEADILRELQEAAVQYIPPYVCGGDLSEDVTQTDLFVPDDGHEADTTGEQEGCEPGDQLAGSSHKRDGAWRCGNDWRRITQRFHHRFVVDFIGKPLSQVTSSEQFIKVVSHAFTAHRQAYESKNKIIHRDISANNILIDVNGNGILNDWDLAKREAELTQARRHERTGTWEFMSCLLLLKKRTIHTIQDDMESFVYIVLYHGLRYFRHSRPHSTKGLLQDIFEYQKTEGDGTIMGGRSKRSMFLEGKTYLGHDFEFESKPLDRWNEAAFAAVQEWLEHVAPRAKGSKSLLTSMAGNALPPQTTLATSASAAHLHLRNHAAMANLFSHCLSSKDWPEPEDPPVDAFPPSGRKGEASQQSSKRPFESDERSSVGGSMKRSRTSRSIQSSKPTYTAKAAQEGIEGPRSPL
ncbi:hypothetical protein FPV67DRAFT_1783297 [Lyophyllum atratum]|nr:hypothetical protein FPV67DRAFT_1783297 [Lyophyllum atratum]